MTLLLRILGVGAGVALFGGVLVVLTAAQWASDALLGEDEPDAVPGQTTWPETEIEA